jgi:hypothetical protein
MKMAMMPAMRNNPLLDNAVYKENASGMATKVMKNPAKYIASSLHPDMLITYRDRT